jgi:hypothetical protein
MMHWRVTGEKRIIHVKEGEDMSVHHRRVLELAGFVEVERTPVVWDGCGYRRSLVFRQLLPAQAGAAWPVAATDPARLPDKMVAKKVRRIKRKQGG